MMAGNLTIYGFVGCFNMDFTTHRTEEFLNIKQDVQQTFVGGVVPS